MTPHSYSDLGQQSQGFKQSLSVAQGKGCSGLDELSFFTQAVSSREVEELENGFFSLGWGGGALGGHRTVSRNNTLRCFLRKERND